MVSSYPLDPNIWTGSLTWKAASCRLLLGRTPPIFTFLPSHQGCPWTRSSASFLSLNRILHHLPSFLSLKTGIRPRRLSFSAPSTSLAHRGRLLRNTTAVSCQSYQNGLLTISPCRPPSPSLPSLPQGGPVCSQQDRLPDPWHSGTWVAFGAMSWPLPPQLHPPPPWPVLLQTPLAPLSSEHTVQLPASVLIAMAVFSPCSVILVLQWASPLGDRSGTVSSGKPLPTTPMGLGGPSSAPTALCVFLCDNSYHNYNKLCMCPP